MGSVSVSSCICCMFVSCVHPVAVLNAAFCMTCCGHLRSTLQRNFTISGNWLHLTINHTFHIVNLSSQFCAGFPKGTASM